MKSSPLKPDPEKVREFMRRNQGKGFRERISTPAVAKQAAWNRQDGKCLTCRKDLRGTRWHPHHFLPAKRWPELQEEPANVGLLHDRCHMNHESAHRRIRRDELPACALRLIDRAGPAAQVYAERNYP